VGQTFRPLFTSLFLACWSSKAKNQEAAHDLKIPLTGNCCVTLPMQRAIAAHHSLSAFKKGFLDVPQTATHHWHSEAKVLFNLLPYFLLNF